MSVRIICFGCGKQAVYDYRSSEDIEKYKIHMSLKGWVRRAFYESSCDLGPWFCCKSCAYESPAAKKAEELAQEDFKKFCQEFPMPSSIWIPLVFLLLVFAAVIVKGCINA